MTTKFYNVTYTLETENNTESFNYEGNSIWVGFQEMRELAEKTKATIYRKVVKTEVYEEEIFGNGMFSKRK